MRSSFRSRIIIVDPGSYSCAVKVRSILFNDPIAGLVRTPLKTFRVDLKSLASPDSWDKVTFARSLNSCRNRTCLTSSEQFSIEAYSSMIHSPQIDGINYEVRLEEHRIHRQRIAKEVRRVEGTGFTTKYTLARLWREKHESPFAKAMGDIMGGFLGEKSKNEAENRKIGLFLHFGGVWDPQMDANLRKWA